jgi:hypothetical protein
MSPIRSLGAPIDQTRLGSKPTLYEERRTEVQSLLFQWF